MCSIVPNWGAAACMDVCDWGFRSGYLTGDEKRKAKIIRRVSVSVVSVILWIEKLSLLKRASICVRGVPRGPMHFFKYVFTFYLNIDTNITQTNI
jgi:hypothetical protein